MCCVVFQSFTSVQVHNIERPIRQNSKIDLTKSAKNVSSCRLSSTQSNKSSSCKDSSGRTSPTIWKLTSSWTMCGLAGAEIYQQRCLCGSASICLRLSVSLTNVLRLYQRCQLWTRNITCCCVTEKVKVSSEASRNPSRETRRAVWSVNKYCTANKTW